MINSNLIKNAEFLDKHNSKQNLKLGSFAEMNQTHSDIVLEIDKKGTFYLNSAIVPRYKTNTKGELFVNFSWVEFEENKLKHISHRWYSEMGEIFEEEILF